MPGFDFSNHNRNVALHAQGVPLPKATSTGTTIVGCIFDGGVVVCTTDPESAARLVVAKTMWHSGSIKDLTTSIIDSSRHKSDERSNSCR